MLNSPKSFPSSGHIYDLIVVGAGISGSEVALHCAKSGLDVLLVTTSLDTIYNLISDGIVLNPPPDTLMAEICAEVANDKGFVSNWACHCRAKYILENQVGIHLLQSNVSSLIVENGIIKGVTTWEGVDRLSSKVVLSVGSFLGARLDIGGLTEQAGRLSEMTYDDLYSNLLNLNFEMEEVCLKVKSTNGNLPYTVKCKHFAEVEQKENSFELRRIKGLYAVGMCAKGYMSFEEAALQGKCLALDYTPKNSL